jgi:hypothetical protein
MTALSMGIILAGYAIGLYGYCLLRGYDITVKQLFSRNWPPNATAVTMLGPAPLH